MTKWRRKLSTFTVLSGLLSFGLLSGTNAQTGAKSVALERFSERLTKDVLVSGRVLVGAVAMNADALGAQPQSPFVLWAPTAMRMFTEPSICVTTASRDGQYFAQGNLTRSLLSGANKPFRIEAARNPSNVKYLQSLGPLSIAQIATDGDCEAGSQNGSRQKVLLLSRQQTDVISQPAGVILLINSERLSMQLELDSTALKATCEELGDGMNKAFDKVCRIEGPLPGRTVVKLIRKKYERTLPAYEFELVWAVQ